MSLYAKVPYDAVKDFAPITMVAYSPNIIAVNPSVPAKSVKELIELIKANPNKYSFAGPGIGSTPHLSGELFKQKFGLDLVHVPFPGAAQAVNSTIAGDTQIAFTALPPALPNIKAGKLRGLAVLAVKRVAELPDVPTMQEAGYSGQEADTLTGVLAPASTPRTSTNVGKGSAPNPRADAMTIQMPITIRGHAVHPPSRTSATASAWRTIRNTTANVPQNPTNTPHAGARMGWLNNPMETGSSRTAQTRRNQPRPPVQPKAWLITAEASATIDR
jgi:hypothetical protein